MQTRPKYETHAPDDGTAAILRTLDGRTIALRGVSIRVALRDLICETEVIQKYQNSENTNIEAVYTFPLPVDAVLLDLEVKLAGKTLRGCVIERKAAQEKYEDAVTSGDSAVLLEQNGDGLYTMNLGNLLVGETAEIRFRYAMLLNWNGDTLRVMIPTTLAPRYGVPSGLQPHEVPEHSLMVEYPLDLAVTVAGALANAAVECPSHAVTIERSQEAARLRLETGATLDRDFVLNVRAPTAAASVATAYPDGEGYVVLASLRPEFPAQSESGPRSIKIVVDCSGSMNGDSITQARTALRAILDQLRPIDEFNVVAFGSTQKQLFARQTAVEVVPLGRAACFVDALAADMGGTEMQAALARAMALPGKVEQADILLITDGEVWNYEVTAALAVKTHHRIFTVGVGSAVAEAVVRQLSAATGGACELVSARENMTATIVRQFQRIYQPYAVSTQVTWPVAPVWEHPHPISAVFGGDTLHLTAGFAAPVEGEVVIEMRFADGAVVKQAVRLAVVTADESLASTAPRLAAARRLKTLEEAEARQLALRYQLMSPYTAYFVLAERDEKAPDLPELRATPQMLAAGWGGIGVVFSEDALSCEQPAVLRMRSRDTIVAALSEYGSYDFPVFLCPSPDAEHGSKSRKNRPTEIAENLNQRFKWKFARMFLPANRQERFAIEVPAEVYHTIQDLLAFGWTKHLVAVCFLHRLSLVVPAGAFSRNSLRAIARAVEKLEAPVALLDYFARCMENVTSYEWNWINAQDAPQPDMSASYSQTWIKTLDIPAFLRKQAD